MSAVITFLAIAFMLGSHPRETSGEEVQSLCESVEVRRAYPTPEQRAATRDTIRRTCAAMGVSRSSCKFMEVIAARESSYRPWVRHKLPGDHAAALRGYLRNGYKYGWEVVWPWRAQRAGDLTAITYTAIVGRSQNPYFLDPVRWEYGLGLGGLNVSNQLWRIDPVAPPEILCDPVLNVFVQVSIARAAVRNYQARTWVEVQAVYGGRTMRDSQGRRRARLSAPMDAAIVRRCRRHGLDCYARPQLGRQIVLRRMDSKAIYDAATKIRGRPLQSQARLTPTAAANRGLG